MPATALLSDSGGGRMCWAGQTHTGPVAHPRSCMPSPSKLRRLQLFSTRPHCREPRPHLHVLRDVVQLEVECIHVHTQQPAGAGQRAAGFSAHAAAHTAAARRPSSLPAESRAAATRRLPSTWQRTCRCSPRWAPLLLSACSSSCEPAAQRKVTPPMKRTSGTGACSSSTALCHPFSWQGHAASAAASKLTWNVGPDAGSHAAAVCASRSCSVFRCSSGGGGNRASRLVSRAAGEQTRNCDGCGQQVGLGGGRVAAGVGLQQHISTPNRGSTVSGPAGADPEPAGAQQALQQRAGRAPL